MIRCRFKIDMAECGNDYRPVVWPIKHPYWCSGQGHDYFILVAYADDEDEILTNWPEAWELDSEEVLEYTFTSRFPKPDWFDLVHGELE
jgi:hypothetical protein